MKKLHLFLFNFGALLWLEMIFGLVVFDSYLKTTIFSVFLFLIPVALFNTLLLSLFKKKTNFIIGIVMYSILGLYFGLQLVFKQVFNSFFQVSLFALGDQVLSFGKETFFAILSNLHYVLLLFVPLVVFILLRNKLQLDENNYIKRLSILGAMIITIVFSGLYFNVIMKAQVPYKLIYKINDNHQSIENLGVVHALFLDVGKTITKFEEEIILVDEPKDSEDDIFKYDYNVLDIDFSKGNNKTINNYMENDIGTKQNKYTGIFEGKNLVYIVAESFHTIGVSKELTPTLYSLINDGFYFENFYVPNNLSTIGGEFQALTGLYPDNATLDIWRSGKNYFPTGLAYKFKENGYKTYSYHNNSYVFQNRNKYLTSQGFNNFKACYNGLEKLINCNRWPQSDIEMIDKTTKDYINNDEPFLAYYMTVSGHFSYTFSDNSIASKNRKVVNHLNYAEPIKGYIATQVELDRALELLIKRLKESGKLEDTVIVLLADHYPYKLSINQINQVSTYKRDSVVEVNHNNLIIWNSELNHIKIDKVCMSADVVPTVYNLFGINYDSRLLMGKDIFSDTEGIAVMKNRSWVTNKGTYYSSNNKFVSTGEEVSGDYVSNINQIINNRLNISKMILSNNYYKSLFK